MVIFGTGVVTGGLLIQHFSRLHPAAGFREATPVRPVSPPFTPSPGGLKLELLRRMQKELDLTPEQHERIDGILSESQEHTRQIMEPVRPLLADELKHARDQFREVLTPEQRARFEDLLRQQQQHPRDARHFPAGRDHFPPPGARLPTNAPPSLP